MDIPLNAEVYGSDGRIGLSTYIVVNPVTQETTHIVVRDNSSHHGEHLVAVNHIKDSDSDTIHLACTDEELAKMELFEEVEFIPTSVPRYDLTVSAAFAWPYVTASQESRFVQMHHRHIPPYERDIRRGAHVHASDGRIGLIEEVIVDPQTLHLTHLVLREGHLWGQKDVMIPVDEIESIEENNIYLKIDKSSVEALPTFPLHHHIKH